MMDKYQSRKARMFRLTWRLGPEGSPEEKTKTNLGSINFFGGGDGFGRSPGAVSPVAFSCESAVCLRVESWGRIWNRSRSPWLAEVPLVEDLKQALKSKRRNQPKMKLGKKEV
jgi:hypothetical protein